MPTWNYAVVHAYGRRRSVEDRAWLRALVERLTDRHEAGRSAWAVSDAPDDFLAAMVGTVVGVELVVTRLVGKWKHSQNRPRPDQDGLLRGLDVEATTGSTALAAAMRRTLGGER